MVGAVGPAALSRCMNDARKDLRDDVEVAVVVVTWNSATTIVDCLRSLHEHPPSRPWRVVVVDNGSADETCALVRGGRFDHALLLAVGSNLGLAAGNNVGMAAIDAPTVVISNPDVVYRPGAADALLDCLDRHPRAAFAIARLLHPDGSLQVSAGSLPSLAASLVGRRLAPGGVAGSASTWWDTWDHREERTVGHGQEACYAVRREAIDDVGPQDARYRLDWEGLDWAARMQGGGWELWFCPAAEVVHVGGVSVRSVPVRWVVSTHRGLFRYHSSRIPAWLRPPLAVAVTARGFAKGLALLARQDLYRAAHR